MNLYHKMFCSSMELQWFIHVSASLRIYMYKHDNIVFIISKNLPIQRCHRNILLQMKQNYYSQESICSIFLAYQLVKFLQAFFWKHKHDNVVFYYLQHLPMQMSHRIKPLPTAIHAISMVSFLHITGKYYSHDPMCGIFQVGQISPNSLKNTKRDNIVFLHHQHLPMQMGHKTIA